MKNPVLLSTIAAIILAFSQLSCQPKNGEKEAAPATPAIDAVEEPRPISNKLKFTTSMGAFTLELLPDIAPKTVENFKKRIRDGFYPGTIFHRVMPDFMIQGGGHFPDMSKKDFRGTVTNEADLAKEKGLTNKRGTISMAYVPGDPYGASVQFFINLKNNTHLDFKAKTLKDYGHCPFGRVTQGMDVVDRISRVKTQTIGNHGNVPVQPVAVISVEEVD
jgi:peptidyl-prolyl cis-trans isomerase B (cyclophilin B)